ncbi:DNA-directed RNA polymerase ii subunit rpb11 [Anaeramoeba flamelloides]|uniref:DNA-directed RNA polymerase ii subunit rpb11 n=1 Tax=Anaeramoeba flamelloides TaxID=1746091 RepID=A0AAV7ZE81_9EUKA|nr:DNA-directed RNA polymerase ii subunit rpb11 [Anaeramoeba flamelloides]KAJ6240784.1 DNA-directed RNA polymerase ii subunit rpb11 [Anaeramoeba flamelloides]
MNHPESYESFVLEQGEDKITAEKDTRVTNSMNFVIRKEDHTLGNLIRMALLEDQNVLFSGYKIPHPLSFDLHLKIQTNGQTTPTQALETSISNLKKTIKKLEKDFSDDLSTFN